MEVTVCLIQQHCTLRSSLCLAPSEAGHVVIAVGCAGLHSTGGNCHSTDAGNVAVAVIVSVRKQLSRAARAGYSAAATEIGSSSAHNCHDVDATLRIHSV
eukprot:COSAG01_NODE_2085_length_8459_cov_14.269139_8_plen_100_part_00